MSEIVELKLFSPLQADIIDRDSTSHAVPLQAVSRERKEEYLEQVMNAVRQLQSQEYARNAFVADQDWSGVSEKIISFTRAVELVHGELYGVFSCRSSEELDPEETDLLKWNCRSRWEKGWGAGYAHCPGADSSLGLYIHFWQDYGAPLLTMEQLEAIQNAEQSIPAVTEVTPVTFWMLLDQAKNAQYQELKQPLYWLTDRLLALGSEQALNFHNIMSGYLELSDKYGLWNAAILMNGNGCSGEEFREFREQLILQGRETYLAALKDPDSLADVSVCGVRQFHSLLYAGYNAYGRLTGHTVSQDIAPDSHQQLLKELRKDIVYGAGIEFPHEWTEVADYLPKLCAAHTTPKELWACARRRPLWNYDDPKIQKAREEIRAEHRRRRSISNGVTKIDKDTFWSLIDQAREHPGDPYDWLLGQLMSLGPEQAQKFDNIACAYMGAAYKYGLWTAASVMEKNGCTDDGFIDFRAWLVGQGKDVYMAALKDPDSLADAPLYQETEFDGLVYAGEVAYKQLTGRDIFQDFDVAEYRALAAELKQSIVYGDGIDYPYTWSQSAVYLPNLCEKYLTPEELDQHIKQHNNTWNVSSQVIKLARAFIKRSTKIEKNRGDTR